MNNSFAAADHRMHVGQAIAIVRKPCLFAALAAEKNDVWPCVSNAVYARRRQLKLGNH